MSWKETSPGRFVRPLTCVEGFFKDLADTGAPIEREHWAVRAYARFASSIEDPETTLRSAWMTMRFDHPQIASFAIGKSRVYQVPDSDALESWLDETFVVSRIDTADELLASLRPTKLPTLHFLPSESAILIQIPHWYIDGTGAMCLLNNMFDAMADPRPVAFGSEARNLSPGVEEAANLPSSLTAKQEQAASGLVAKYTSNLPSFGLSLVAPGQVPGATRRRAIIFSSDTTRAVVSACRVRKITVTAGVHAALIAATHRLASDESKFHSYTSWGTFSLRPYLSPAFTDAKAHPVNLYLCGLPLVLKPSTFSSDSSWLNLFYKQLALPGSSAEILPLLPSYTQKCADMARQPAPSDIPEASEPVLSSIGIVDRYLKPEHGNSIEVSDFWLSSEVLSREPLVYAWTWQDQFSLSVCYNEHYYTSDIMIKLLEITREILLEELGVLQPSIRLV